MRENKENYVVVETREYEKPINDFLIGERYYDIYIKKGENINNSLLDEVSKKIKEKLRADQVVISKSKNYVPENDKLRKYYEWHSWNALTKEKINENPEYYLFAIKIESAEEDNEVLYKCLVFRKAKFQELLDNITITANNRYFFYFAHSK